MRGEVRRDATGPWDHIVVEENQQAAGCEGDRAVPSHARPALLTFGDGQTIGPTAGRPPRRNGGVARPRLVPVDGNDDLVPARIGGLAGDGTEAGSEFLGPPERGNDDGCSHRISIGPLRADS